MNNKKIGEWSTLTHKNIPSDLFADYKKYQVQIKDDKKGWILQDNYANGHYGAFVDCLTSNDQFRYRITPPPRPDHKVIMENFWEIKENMWYNVHYYDPKNKEYQCGTRLMTPYEFEGMNHSRIPPEDI